MSEATIVESTRSPPVGMLARSPISSRPAWWWWSGARSPRGGPGPPRQSEVAGRGQGQGQAGFGASASRGMYRVGEVTKVRVQQTRREIGGGDGGMRTLRLGIQPEQADERVGGATTGRTGRVIRCGLVQTKPPGPGFGFSTKTNACSLGEVLPTATKFPGKLQVSRRALGESRPTGAARVRHSSRERRAAGRDGRARRSLPPRARRDGPCGGRSRAGGR